MGIPSLHISEMRKCRAMCSIFLDLAKRADTLRPMVCINLNALHSLGVALRLDKFDSFKHDHPVTPVPSPNPTPSGPHFFPVKTQLVARKTRVSVQHTDPNSRYPLAQIRFPLPLRPVNQAFAAPGTPTEAPVGVFFAPRHVDEQRWTQVHGLRVH